jgi:hypothetical protein
MSGARVFPPLFQPQILALRGSNEVTTEAEKMIKKLTTVIADRRPCYNRLKDYCNTVQAIIIKDKRKFQPYFQGYTLQLVKPKRNCFPCITR